jgi:transcriptional regulator with XRE-family HTH domain
MGVVKNTAFATAVRQEMDKRGLSQTELARRAGCTQPAVSQLLSGQRKAVSLEMALSIADALDLPLDALVRHRHNNNSRSSRTRQVREWLLSPPPGSSARRAQDFGIDLTLNVRRLSMLIDLPLGQRKVLAAIAKAKVRYVIIGGVAMRLQASAILTYDLDIAYARDTENIRGLVAALRPFRPRLRGVKGDVPFRFDERTISSGLNFTLTTEVGDVDLLGSLAGFKNFEAVWASSETRRIAGIDVQVLNLEGLIKAKRAAGRAKDFAFLPELEALLEVRQKFGEKDK